MNLRNKLIAGFTAMSMVAMSFVAVPFNAAADSTENQAAYDWAFAEGLTSMNSLNAFNFEGNVTREAAARFLTQGAEALGYSMYSDQECNYSDLASADQSLVEFINQGCEMGVFKAQDMFNPKQLLTRAQAELTVARIVYGMDEVSAYATDNNLSEYAAARELLMEDGIINFEIPAASAVKRGHLILMLYRLSDIVDPTDPTPGTGTVVKAGQLDVSLNTSSPANGSSIPYNGVVSFGKVDLKAGSADITVNTVKMKRTGLGQSTDISRVYFEKNGVRISSRANVNSDGEVITTFTPALVVKANSTETVDLVVEMAASASALGGEHAFTSIMIDSTAQTSNGSFATPLLRTSNYAVRVATFTNLNATTTYNGNETQTELGKFQLLNNGGSQVIDLGVKAITLRNVGNSNATSLSNLALYRGGVKVSDNVILNGRDVTFTLNDNVKDAQTAAYTIFGTVNNVDNAGGDTYKFILRQTSDLSIVESTTNYRAGISLTANTANDANLINGVYTVNGGELRFAQDSSALSQLSVSQGSLRVSLMKGTLTAKQGILLENPTLAITAGSATIANFATKYTLVIGGSTFSWTPTNGATSAIFDGSVTVNGTVPVELYADVRSNATAGTTVKFGNLSANSFARKEYVSTQNNVTSTIGTIAGRTAVVTNAVLDVSRSDGLTNVKVTNNATNKLLYSVKLTNSQDNDIKVGAITLSPTTSALNNDVSVDLVVSGAIVASKTLNGDTVFNGLNIIVKKNIPVELQFRGNFLSTATAGETTQFAVKFAASDAIDNTTANNVSVGGVAANTALATSTSTSIIGGGTVQVTNSSAAPAQGFVTPIASTKVGSFNVQAINDDLEVRGLYLTIVGLGGFATQAGNQISNFVIKDQNGVVVATESAKGGANNEIVKFNNFITNTVVAQGTTKRFDVFATINDVTSATSAGEFTIKIDTAYTDAQYPEIYNGMRILSVNAGTYVNGTSITANNLTNTLNVVSSFPILSTVDSVGNATKLVEFKITNGGSTNLTVNGLSYFQTAQLAADIQGKAFKIYNGNDVVFAGTTDAGNTASITFANPLVISPNTNLTLVVQLDNPFVNTAATPTAGNRKFQITNLSYAQTFTDGSSTTFGNVAPAYINQVGLNNLTASY